MPLAFVKDDDVDKDDEDKINDDVVDDDDDDDNVVSGAFVVPACLDHLHLL